MDIREFINQKKFIDIERQLSDITNHLDNNGFNLFTISTYTSHLENFHSDVIKLLLTPEGRHKSLYTYLDLFIHFINTNGGDVKQENYRNSIVSRETGKIDVWIRDNDSKKCIIIENKINNAGDQKDQLERYYNYAIGSGYHVDCIIYLTLNENKKAPLTSNTDINDLILNISAFSNSSNDLYNGWILPCYETSKNNEDCASFIYQYGKLLKHLSKMGLGREIKDDFYEIVSQNSGLEKAKAITELINGLEQYRADVFMESIGKDYLPFKKIYRYKPWHWLFENFIENNVLYKLDVHFDYGNARIDFWNPDEQDRDIITQKLAYVGLLEDFKEYGFGNGMYKEFSISINKSLKDVDEELAEYVKSLFRKLRNAHK